MKWVTPPVAYMLHAGLPLLLEAGVSLPGLCSGDEARVALEAYPGLLARSGLLNGKFAPVNLLTYESTLKPGIHVIGDACISGMPKAGHIGNQEAKTCANAIVNAIKGSLYALEETAPVLNSACYTPLTSTRATWLSAVYQYANGVMVPSTENGITQPRAAASATTGNYGDMEKWFATLMGDTFS